MTAVDEIKSRLDIVDYISQTVKLKRSGRSYTGFCPFHPNTRTPAFAVFPENGTWRCFGQCNEGGDIFKFVMKKEGWDFPATLRYLAEKAGVRLEPLTPQRQQAEEEHARLRSLLEDSVIFYRNQLTQTPAGKPALEFLLRRGLTPQTIETFGLGYAPLGWENLLNYLTTKGYSPKEMADAGMVLERSARESGTQPYRDRFHNRVLFPIRDGMGKMCGFGGRILDPNDVPKFLNSPQTVLFDKGRLLYGLDQARKAIRAAEEVVIVEGYLDAIVLHQAGYQNTVSPMGTALTEDQFRLLKRFTRRMTLALDADAAGAKATMRGLEMARETLDRGSEVAFDSRGLLRYEMRLQADIRITQLPEGKDPDEVVLEDPAAWQKILDEARPVVEYVMQTLAASHNLEDAKEKRVVAEQVLPLIADIPNPIERDTYRQRLAHLLKIDERALGSAVTLQSSHRKIPVKMKPERMTPSSALSEAKISRATEMERHVIGYLLQQPERVYNLDRRLQAVGLERVSEADFLHSDHNRLMEIITSALLQDSLEPLEAMRLSMPEELGESASQITPPADEKLDPRRLLDDILRTIIELRRLRLNESVSQLRYMQEELVSGDAVEELREINRQALELTRQRNKLDSAFHKAFTA